MGIIKDYINQTRKPEGVLGRMMVDGMNGGHAKIADWGMSHLTNVAPKKILELGCGGGRNIGELLRRYPSSTVTGVDYSEVSVKKSKEYNKSMIEAGRCNVKQGDVSKLPLKGEEYELATAFETIYFWPGLEKCFAQVAKVLKPGGLFMIVNESNGEDKAGKTFEKMVDGMTCYSAEQIEAALTGAGFSKISVDYHKTKPWIAVLARK